MKDKYIGEVIATLNQKGGVAKTTTAQCLARELAKEYKVLLIDMDGQKTLTELIDLYSHFDRDFLDKYLVENSITKIFNRESISPLDITSIINIDESEKINELHFIPSAGNAMNFIAEGASGGKDLLLNKFLTKIKHEYDYIIIDSLPSVTTLFKNIMLSADILLIPIETRTNSIAGANEFANLINDIIGDYEKDYKHIYLLPTKFNKQRRDDNDVLAEIKTSFLRYIKSTEFLGKINTSVLDPIPERSVFSNAQAVRYFLQDYIEYFDTGKRDILLLIEKMAKNIANTTSREG